jgi:murein DD-endopeptidase MepM/ murein hydrolase activator NlpD
LSLVCGFVIGACGMAALVNLTRVDRSSGLVSTHASNEQTSSSIDQSVTTVAEPSSTTSTSSTGPTTAATSTTTVATTTAATSTAATTTTTVATTTTTAATTTSHATSTTVGTTTAGPSASSGTTTTTTVAAEPDSATTTSTTQAPDASVLDDPLVIAVPTPPGGWPVRAIVFPVAGPVSFDDSWGAFRGTIDSHFHIGVDLIGARLQPIVAVADGVIRRFVIDHSTAGWGIVLTSSDGWEYRYYHINNDSPGTDDGSNPEVFRFAPGLVAGDRVRAGQLIGYMGDSGDSETSVPHLHFEIHRPDDSPINPFPSVRAAERTTRCTPPENFGQAGDLQFPLDTDAQVVQFAATEGKGSFILSANGTVFLAGSARQIGQASHATADGPCPTASA